ncbi:MAG: GumC family protein [Terriglobales bacterium]
MRLSPPGEVWLRALRRRGGVLVMVLLASLAGAAASVYCRQPQYEAVMRVRVQRRTPWLQFPRASPAALPGPTAVETAAQELSNRTVIASALAAMGPQAPGLFTPPLRRPRWLAQRWPGLPSARLQEQIEAVRRRLHISYSDSSRLLELSFTAPRPELAQALLRHLALADLARSATDQRAAATARIEYLQSQAASARANTQAAVRALAAVAAADGLSDPATQLQLTDQRWRQLAAAETTSELMALQLGDALAHHAAVSSGVAAATVVPSDLLLQQAELESQVQSLAVQYQPRAAPLRQARLRLAAVSASIRAVRSRARDQQQQALAAVQQQTRDLRATLVRQSLSQTRLSAALARFDLVQQQLAAQRRTYAAVLEQLQQALVTAGAVVPPLRIADPATPLPRPVAPHAGSALAAASLLGLALGLVAIRVLEGWDDRLRWPEAGEMGVPLAAVLPAPALPWTAWADTIGPASPLPDFALARERCTAALLAARLHAGLRVLFLTSVAGGEGTTTLALHLAACLSRMHQSVLLLDAHPAAPALHRACGGNLTPGVQDLLAGGSTVEAVLRSFACEPGIHLRFAAAGISRALSPCLLLAGGAAAELLSAARERFDWVILDGPPLASGPEAGLWAELADATFVLARYGKTRRRQLRCALDRIEAAGVPELALVINFAPAAGPSATLPLWRPIADPAAGAIPLRQRA